MLKTSNVQDSMVSNRFIIGIVAFAVSFGFTLVITWWNFYSAFITGSITMLATFTATFIVDKRTDKKRRNYESLVVDSFYKRIQELEKVQNGINLEVQQLEATRRSLYQESNQLQHQVGEYRNQRDSLNRELSTFALQKRHLESQVISLRDEAKSLEKSKQETEASFANISAEKRRLELNCNVSKNEITQLHTKIGELLQEREELDSNLILLDRLKPQLEERVHELRVQVEELETEQKKQQELYSSRSKKQEVLKADIKLLKTQKEEEKTHLEELQAQTSLLREERDLLQNQVWELLQQLENLNPQLPVNQVEVEEETEEFPFDDLVEAIVIEPAEKIADKSEEVASEWQELLQSLPEHEIKALKIILKQVRVKSSIKKIAEKNITMPNLLIDSINERAQNTVGELIISTSEDIPAIYDEYKDNIQNIITMSEGVENEQPSS
ncbi:MAG: tellurite resistance TerB C-terminal domain-containing protein [Cyanobacteriota bacterium]|nr:tellurite resistance TerB C-terminal domain-containing protein [Cyanobacteriota bacterium]